MAPVPEGIQAMIPGADPSCMPDGLTTSEPGLNVPTPPNALLNGLKSLRFDGIAGAFPW